MTVKTTIQYSVMVPNEPARLDRATRIIADAGVDLSGVAMSSLGAGMWLRFLSSGHHPVRAKLESKGLEVCESRVLRVESPADSNLLDRVAARLATRGINILSCYGQAVRGRATWVLSVDRIDDAVAALSDLCVVETKTRVETPALLPA